MQAIKHGPQPPCDLWSSFFLKFSNFFACRPSPKILRIPSESSSSPQFIISISISNPSSKHSTMKALYPPSSYLHNHSPSLLLLSSSSSSHRYHRKSVAVSSPPSIRRPDADRCSLWSHGGPSVSSRPRPRLDGASGIGASEARDELGLFLDLLPLRMRRELVRHDEIGDLIEVVMDLGRKPIARFPSGDWFLSDKPIGLEDLRHAISKVGEFSDDNRSGINNSLHRISAIRNRKMQIIGLTCRVGRAVSGSAEMLRDLVEGGGSLLVIGPPGVGKTTLIREIARMLADEHKKRVVIVDTSNEIGGDGDIPHSGIGRARRMQVPNVNMQHDVMIEAVENHMPEVIIIDEIGTELEARAASTIAQRGVQLVGTAHGVTIESIVKNPCLQELVGGIESVTLGDEEARKRKVQKTILERKGPPTFTCAVEMISKTECQVHHKLEATVDTILAGKPPLFEVRKMDLKANNSKNSPEAFEEHKIEMLIACKDDQGMEPRPSTSDFCKTPGHPKKSSKTCGSRNSPTRVYTYKILEADLLQVAKVMGLENDIDVTDDIMTANAILASKSEMKDNPWIRSVAKYHQLPVFVIKENTMAQMVKAVRMILGMDMLGSTPQNPVKHLAKDIEIEDDAPERKPSLEEIDALEEVRLAIEYIVIPGGEPVELLPRCSEIIARQLELVESYQLAAEKSGTELNSRLQILPQKLNKKTPSGKCTFPHSSKSSDIDSLTSGNAGASVARLPLLPE
ncbi:putative AAA domain-containing protein, R3H [Dioscorea sansibarensis]